jgi:hypothetical protein
MKIIGLGAVCAALLASTAVSADPVFNRIASFPVNTNLPADVAQATETSPEIIYATEDGHDAGLFRQPARRARHDRHFRSRPIRSRRRVMLDGEPTAGRRPAARLLVHRQHLRKLRRAVRAASSSVDMANRRDRGELRSRRPAGFSRRVARDGRTCRWSWPSRTSATRTSMTASSRRCRPALSPSSPHGGGGARLRPHDHGRRHGPRRDRRRTTRSRNSSTSTKTARSR